MLLLRGPRACGVSVQLSLSSAFSRWDRRCFSGREGSSSLRPLSVEGLQIQRRIGSRPPPPKPEGLGFASCYSDLMCEADWDDQQGWSAPRIRPLAEMSLHPGITGLHYAVSCLEGLKAFKATDGRLLLFRPLDHIARFQDSAARLALPVPDAAALFELLKRFVRLEEEYVLPDRGCSLYLRPLLFSTYTTLGVYPTRAAKLVIMGCPSGAYFGSAAREQLLPFVLLLLLLLPKQQETAAAGGGRVCVAAADGLRLHVETQFVRSWPGGCGAAKVACNYAPTLRPYKDRQEQGFHQLLWTFPEGGDFMLTEAGAMSLFVLWEAEEAGGGLELATPLLTRDLILPGIIRDSILQLVRHKYKSIKAAERPIWMKKDFIPAFRAGKIKEIFCCGTGALVVSVQQLHFEGETFSLDPSSSSSSNSSSNSSPTGSSRQTLAEALKEDLLDIQMGLVPGHPFVVEC
ncbi:hypothetical protein Efla_001239 [Eimeria flavescens]